MQIPIVNEQDEIIAYKDRKDRIFGVGVNKTLNEQPLTYNVKSYWKIKFK